MRAIACGLCMTEDSGINGITNVLMVVCSEKSVAYCIGEDGDMGILVIEDDYHITQILRDSLGQTYSAVFAQYARKGMKLLTEKTKLVILDYMLPDSDGLDVLRRIKRIYPQIPVLFMTGYGNEDVCLEAFRAGARDYIKKPFCLEELLAKVDILVRGCNNETRSNRIRELEARIGELCKSRKIPSHILYRLIAVKDYMDENYTKQMDVTEAAKMANMGRTYFCKYFKQVTGYSLVDYSHYIKIERSKDFLRDMNASIAEVSAAVGYNSPTYFIETFKKITGVTPSQYRIKIRTDGSSEISAWNS